MLSPAAKARLNAPLILAIIVVAGGLYAIVWTVQWSQAGSTTSIQAATRAGAAMVQPHQPSSYANNVGDALPAFTLAQLTTHDLQWDNPTWLATAIDDSGGRWVWADAWFACAYIEPDTLTYTLSAEFGETWDRKVWAGLAVQQLSVIEVCNAQ